MTFATGIMAALVAPLAMVFGFVLWDNHWTGSPFALNLYKCNLAALGFAVVVSLSIATSATTASVFTVRNVGFLMLSSLLGILIGDWAWLEGMRLLGARKIIVIDSLKPFMAALLGHLFLQETLPPLGWLGMVLTVIGVALVGLEEDQQQQQQTEQSHNEDIVEVEATESDRLLPISNGDKTTSSPSSNNAPKASLSTGESHSFAEQRKQRQQTTMELAYGLLVAFSNVVFHTFGALITKSFGAAMTTWEICLIRFGFAGLVTMTLSMGLSLYDCATPMTRSNSQKTSKSLSPWYKLPSNVPTSSWLAVSTGVAFVSFLQPALTNYGLFQISLALLLTLESIGPLYSLPMSYVLQGEVPTAQATWGACLAVTGIVVLSWNGIVVAEKDNAQ